MDMITGGPLPPRGAAPGSVVSEAQARTDVQNWFGSRTNANAPFWQKLWETDIEGERRTKNNDRRALTRPTPDPSQQRLVLAIPDSVGFSSVHAKELIKFLLADNTMRLTFEGLKARTTILGDSGLIELCTLLENDAVTGQPLFPNFKKLVLVHDPIQQTQSNPDWWKRDAFKAFCEALRFNSTLTWLDLSNNTLYGDSPKFLGAALITNSTLRILKIDHTRIMPEMADCVLFCLQRNHTLQYLSWFQLEVSQPSSLKHLMDMLRYNVSLGVVKVPLDESRLKKHEVFQSNLQITLFRDPKVESKLAAILDENDDYQTRRQQWVDQYTRGGSIDDLVNNMITMQAQLKRSTQHINLSDIRIGRALPTNAIRSTITSLTLVRCGLRELPPELGGFKGLERLVVAFNQLTVLPACIGQLRNLREIDAGHNRLTFDLPVDMAELTQLEKLFLHQNDIQQFPNVLERIPSLRILDLQSNRIATIPDEFFEGCCLIRQLFLSDNPLQFVPSTIQHCKFLMELALSRTSLEYLPVELHYIYKDKENMTSITLDGTPMAATLPPTIAKNVDLFTHLRSLEETSRAFPYVKLMFVGEGAVGKTTLLKLMEEEGRKGKDKDKPTVAAPSSPAPTQATARPGTPGPTPTPGGTVTRERGLTTVRVSSMWTSRGLSTASRRMLATASAAAVSGTMTPQLTQSTSRLRLNENRSIATDGIDIREVKIPGSGNSMPITFRSWDFAGQEVYYATHQFFLSKSRSLYLVLFNAAHVASESTQVLPGNMAKGGWFTVEYWLQSLEARAGEPCVMLVGTHLDEIPDKSRDQAAEAIRVKATNLQKRYKFIEGLCLVSPDSRSSIQDLRKRLYELATKKNMVGQPVPTSYMQLDEYIQKLNEARRAKSEPAYLSCMSWIDFKALAATFQVPDEDAKDAAAFLNEVGTLVFFEEEHTIPYVFLDPQWLADVMASIFSFKHNYGKSDGRLRRDQLLQLWKEPEYPREMHHVLLRLLEKFEIVVPLPAESAANKGTPGMPEAQVLLVPHWLPEERPSLSLQWPDFDVTDTEYRRRYKLGFVPTGLFSRLMVRLLHFTKGTRFWRSGILLELNENRALVELNKSSQVLDVAVRGPSAPKLLRVLLETVDALMTNWFQIKTERSVPCTHCLAMQAKLVGEPTYFSIDDCQMAIAESRNWVECKGVRVQLERLIPDVSMRDIGGVLIDFKKDLQIEKPIGKGGFGIIYKALWRNQVVAVKMLMLDKDVPTEDKAKMYGDFRQEVWLMSGLIHPNVVSLLGYCTEPYAMVMDFVSCGDLYGFLHNEQRSVDWPTRLKIALDIAKGMEFLHTLTPPLLHRDLKSPNILLDSTDATAPITAKVSDFGLSSLLFIQSFKEKSQDRAVANPTWLAPEVLNEEEYSEKSDVYAAGIMMHELLTRRHPYDEFKFKFMWELEDIIIAEKRPSIPADCPPSYRALVQDTWAPQPAARPSFTEVCRRLLAISAELCPGFRLVDSVTALKSIKAAAPLPAPVSPAGRAAVPPMPPPFSLPPPPALPAPPAREAPGMALPQVTALAAERPLGGSPRGAKPATPPPAEAGEFEPSSGLSSSQGAAGGFVAARPNKASGKSSARLLLADRSSGGGASPSTSSRRSDGGHYSAEEVPLPTPVPAFASPAPPTPTAQAATSPYVSPQPVRGAAAASALPPVAANRMISTNVPAAQLARPGNFLASSMPRTAANTVAGAEAPAAALTGRCLTTIRVDSPRVTCLASVGRQVWTGAGDGTIHTWSAHSGEWIMSIPRAHYASVTGLACAGSAVWSCSLDKTMRSWSAEEARPNKEEKQKKLAIRKAAPMNVLEPTSKKADEWKARFVTLDNMRIQLFKKEKDKERDEELVMTEVQSAAPRDVPKHSFCFAVNGRGRTFVFEARSAAERDEWLAAIEGATVLGKKKKPTRTLIDGDRITAMCAVSADVLWSATGQLQLTVRDARSGESRGQKKLELQVLQANLPTVSAMLRPRSSPHVWIALAHLVFRYAADSASPVDALTVLPPAAAVTALCDVNGSEVWVAGSDGSLAAWSAATGKQAKGGLRDPAAKRPVTAMCAVAGQVWAVSDRLTLWDARTYTVTHSVASPHTEPATQLLYLADLKTVWCAALDSTLSIWT